MCIKCKNIIRDYLRKRAYRIFAKKKEKKRKEIFVLYRSKKVDDIKFAERVR